MLSQVKFILIFNLFLYASAQNSKAVLLNYPEFAKKITNFDKVIAPLADTPDGLILALKLLDASTKIPTGVLAGNFFDLGNFDECYAIEYDDLFGKYCLGTTGLNLLETTNYIQLPLLNISRQKPILQVHPDPRILGLGSQYMGFHFAACVLSNVSASDISFLQEYDEEFCYSKATEKQLSNGAIATIVLLAFIWVIICASTIYDIVLYYRKRETAHEVLLAFSVLTNGRKIFKSTNNPDQLLCLNGMKALSMMWVIIGHDYNDMMNAPMINMFEARHFSKAAENMFLLGATVSVDTFFVVGGLVTVYTFMRSARKGEKFNILLFYLHRYLRLTPALAIISLVSVYLLNYLGNGPLWKSVDLILAQPCEKGWWSTLLYITNYVQDGICAPQSWYLSVDMQLFVLSPIVLLLLPKNPKIGLTLLGCLTVAGCIAPFCVIYFNEISNMMADEDYQNLYYIQTYTRFGPYVIGMILGYFIYKIKFDGLKFKLNMVQAVALWLVLLTGLVACVYAGYPLNVGTEPDIWGTAFFAAFNRSAWGVVISGMILLCITGHGGPIDAFLSLPIFQFLTKLSYSMYLVHYAVIAIRIASYKTLVSFSHFDSMHAFWGDFMWTLVFSFLLCVSFESPIIVLEKWLFASLRKPRQKATKGANEEV